MSAAKHEKRLITAEELWEMPEVPGTRLELAGGEAIEVPGAGGVHALIVKVLLRLLDPFVTTHRLGEVFGDGLAYIICRDPDVVRVPDVSFISAARIPETGIPEGFIPFAPDLAVEIVSPNDRAEDVHDKVSEYLGAGTRMVLVLWPKRRTVTVFEPGDVARAGSRRRAAWWRCAARISGAGAGSLRGAEESMTPARWRCSCAP